MRNKLDKTDIEKQICTTILIVIILRRFIQNINAYLANTKSIYKQFITKKEEEDIELVIELRKKRIITILRELF